MDITEPTPQPDPEPSEEFVSARARRRRAQRRGYFPSDEQGRGELFAHLARRAYPSYELFVFSLVSGVILGLGYFLNSQALLIFGILVAPLMTPWIGISLAAIAGSLRFFLQTLIAVLISFLIVFLSGWLAGFASRAVPPRVYNEAFTHSRLWWDVEKIARNMRRAVAGGSALPVEILKQFKEKFGVQILEGYGLSETSPVACSNRPDIPRKPGSFGVADLGRRDALRG